MATFARISSSVVSFRSQAKLWTTCVIPQKHLFTRSGFISEIRPKTRRIPFTLSDFNRFKIQNQRGFHQNKGFVENDYDLVFDDFEVRSNGSLEREDFSRLGISSSLCRALEREAIFKPTLIQERALRVTMTTQSHCMIRSETGSGKTLTFLLPALQEKLVGLHTLIIVPSRELAVQMLYQAKNLSTGTKNKKKIMAFYTGAFDNEDQLFQAYRELRPNILIATGKPLLKLLETNKVDFVNIRRLVLDEVDKLLLVPNPKKLRKTVMRSLHPRPATVILEKLLKVKKCKPQLIATSATLESSVQRELTQLGWGDHPRIINSSQKLLKSPPNIQHFFLQCSDTTMFKSDEQKDKVDTLVEHFKASREKSALVFIHKGAPITQFIYELQKRKLKVEALHENIKSFEHYSKFIEAFRSGGIELVVATEETVRGLDFAWLNTVYLLEVPKTAADYLHLCGRVGRVGRAGQSLVIVENRREMIRLDNHYRKLGVTGKEI